MICPEFKISFFLEAKNSGLFANLTICGIADLENPCVLAGIGLKVGFFPLVTNPSFSFVLTNQFRNLVLLMQSFVNFSNILVLCTFKDDIFASRSAQENY